MGSYTNHCNLLDLCAAAVPAGEAAEDVPFGITLFGLADEESLLRGAAERVVGAAGLTASALAGEAPVSAASEDTTLVAVCGLHMRGFALEPQMLGSGAVFVKETHTAAKYSLLRLATTPAKPGLLKHANGGEAVELEVWSMPRSAFGAFVAAIPSPLGIGKIELADGTEVPGFICEGYAAAVDAGAEDITSFGGWRAYMMHCDETRRLSDPLEA
jgi:allophanate hydrolase